MGFNKLIYLFALIAITYFSNNCFCQITDTVYSQYNVTLKEAHIGSLRIDTMLLNSYETIPSNIKQFYLDSRSVFSKDDVGFSNKLIVEACPSSFAHLSK